MKPLKQTPCQIRMSGPTLASRFSTLPRMQEERQQESTLQARQAEQLTDRLKDTMEQAEKIVKEEIDRTRSLELALLESHPDWVQWNFQRNETRRLAEEWDLQQNSRINELQKQLETEKASLDAKEGLIRRLEQEQQANREKYQDLERQRANLMMQLDEAKHGEASARERLNDVDRQLAPLKQRLLDIEGSLEDNMRRQHAIEPEIQAARRKKTQIESQIQSLQRQIEALDLDYGNLDGRRMCMLGDIAKANALIDEAQQAVDEHQTLYSSLQSSVRSSEERLFKARDAAQNALQLQGKAAELIKASNDKLAMVRQESQGLRARRDELQRQIEQLLREQTRVIDQMNQTATRENAILEEIRCLENDQREASSFYEAAVESQRRIEGASRQSNESFAKEKQLIEEYMVKKREAEAEKNRAQGLLKDVESQMDRLLPRRSELSSQLDAVQSSYAGHDAHLNQLENDKVYLGEQIRGLQDQISAVKYQVQTLQEERRSATEFMNNCTNSIRFLNQQMADLQASFKALPTRQEDRIRALQAEIGHHQTSMDELSRQLNMPRELNPHVGRLQAIEADKDRVISHVKEELHSNPPMELTDQLKREAEAIMRAEFASGLYARQVQIRNETKELSQLRAVHEPRFSFDQQATGRLFGEHLQGADYRRIASTVVELAETSHIIAQ